MTRTEVKELEIDEVMKLMESAMVEQEVIELTQEEIGKLDASYDVNKPPEVKPILNPGQKTMPEFLKSILRNQEEKKVLNLKVELA